MPQHLRFGETFLAVYPGDPEEDAGGPQQAALYCVGRENDQPTILTVNSLVYTHHAGDRPVLRQGEEFVAEGVTFRVTSEEGFALAVDRVA